MKHPMILVLALAVGLFSAAGCSSDKTTQATVPQDDAPPLPPSGLDVSLAGDGCILLSWSANTEADLAGYRVYVFDPLPARENAYVLQNADALLAEASYAFRIPIGGSIWVRVTAVDQDGNESGAAGPMELVWQNSPPTNPTGGGKPPIETNEAPGSGRGNGTSPPGPVGPPGSGHDVTTPGDNPTNL